MHIPSSSSKKHTDCERNAKVSFVSVSDVFTLTLSEDLEMNLDVFCCCVSLR